MRVLAIETSSTRGSVAALTGIEVLGQVEIDADSSTAAWLAQGIAGQLAAVGWHPGDIQLVAVAQGPGSFTGLRVGVTTAKTLAYATHAELIGVNTLHTIATQVPEQILAVDAVVDAHRQQVFSARFQRDEDGWMRTVRQTDIIDDAEWLAGLDPAVSVSGPAMHKFIDHIPAGITLVDEDRWSPRAETIGRLGFRSFQAGRRDDAWKLAPCYYRTSAAEERSEKRRRKGAG